MVKTEGIVKKFGRKTVLRDISLELQPGVYGLLGPNGAGKTTFVRCLIGIYRANKGRVMLNGSPVSKKNSIVDHLGYLPQKFGLYKELKVYEAMEYMATIKKVEKSKIPSEIERCVGLVNLTDRMWKKVGTLSGGMVRRLGIAVALLGDPEIMIFDEPTSGLDPEERMRFKNIVKTIQKDKVILISTHIIDDVEALCDRIVIIGDGTIVRSGTLQEIADSAAGKVYELPGDAIIPPDLFVAKIEEKYENRYYAGKRVRVLSANPVEGGTPLDPTVEDGYMCAIKKI